MFWILFAEFNRQKIEVDIDAKERVRRQIVDAFWNSAAEDESSMSNNGPAEQPLEQQEAAATTMTREKRVESQKLLRQYLDRLLYLPEVGSGCEDKDKEVLN